MLSRNADLALINVARRLISQEPMEISSESVGGCILTDLFYCFIYLIRYPSHGGSLSHWVWQRAFHKHSGKFRIVRIDK